MRKLCQMALLSPLQRSSLLAHNREQDILDQGSLFSRNHLPKMIKLEHHAVLHGKVLQRGHGVAMGSTLRSRFCLR